MEIKQSRNSNRTRYEFGADRLHYQLQDTSGSRSFSVAYTDISRDRQTLEERNQWMRNAGILWLALGAAVTAANWIGGKGGMPSIWLLLGAACVLAWRFRTTRFTVVPTDAGNMFVIDDKDGELILKEMETRRARQFRDEYDFMPESETAEQHRNRFKWLHREGVLTEEELTQRLTMVGGNDGGFDEVSAPPGTRH